MTERLVVIARIALRNIRRQVRRSVLTASAMVLGIGLLMFVRAWEAGAHVMYIESAARLGTGHIAIEHPEYMGSQDLIHRIRADRLAAARAAVLASAKDDEIKAVMTRVTVGGLAQSASSSNPVRISGVDPSVEAPVSLLTEKIVEGRYLEPADRLEAVIGAGVAERLRVELGSRVVLMAQGGGGELESQLVLVAGIFHTGIPEVDRGVVQVPLETARAWLGLNGDATSLNVVLTSDRRTAHLAEATREHLQGAGVGDDAVRVQPWWEALPDLYAGLQADAVGTYIMFLILLAIVGLAVVNSVLMAVLNRTREFGVLRALGLNRRSVGAMVMIEGTLLTFASGIAGMALGLFISVGLFRDGFDMSWFLGGDDLSFGGTTIDPVVIPAVLAGDVLAIVSIVILIGILASVYPAWQATRIEPAEAMKSED